MMSERDLSIAVVSLCTAFVALVLAQVIKFVVWSIKAKRPVWIALYSTGGWPSSHSSLVTSLSCIILFLYDFKITLFFVIALVSNIIVTHDAMGVRLEASKHAVILNDMSEELSEKGIIPAFNRLKEQLGHKPLEVIIGMLLGAVIAILSALIFYQYLPAAA